MRLIYVFMTFSLLSGCVIVDPESGPYSLDQIIALRLADDQRINGKEIVVDSILNLTVKSRCLAVASRQCAGDQGKDDLSQFERMKEYGHERKFSYVCNQGVLRLMSDNNNQYEAIDIDYGKDDGFEALTENKEVRGVFEVKVEFTDEVDYCANKIYKGTRITLTDVGYQKVLQLLERTKGNKQ